MFDEFLDDLVSRIDGAQGVILLADDGEAVQWAPLEEGPQLRLLGAYVTVALKNWRAAAEFGAFRVSSERSVTNPIGARRFIKFAHCPDLRR